jgi:hypothetical protein
MRITDLNQLFTASLNNVLYIIDTNDTGSFFSGSSKQITVGDFLSSSGVVGNGTSSYSLNANTSSYAFNANTSSYAFTSSYALNSGTSLITGSNYPITSSWALRAISASISNTSSYISPTFISESAASSGFGTGGGGTTLITGSTYPITSSWSINAFTASYSLTASYALNAVGGGIYLSSESFFANGLSSSYTITSSVLEASEDIFVFINGLVQAPTTNYSLSSSILVFNGIPSTGSLIEVRRFDANISGSGGGGGGGGGGGTTLTTGSTYPITSSWAITASYALAGLVFGNIDGGNPSEIYSYTSNIDGGNP